MRKRIVTLLITVVMLFSIAVPAYAIPEGYVQDADVIKVIASYHPYDMVSVKMLNELYGAIDSNVIVTSATQQDAVIFALRYAGMTDNQLSTAAPDTEQFAYDCTELAKSMGILSWFYSANDTLSVAELGTILQRVAFLYNALHADKLQPLFMNGMAQPIFPYTSGIPADGSVYSNADSDIIRFCVYVETNYDTDGDGKLDLVKALVQLPRAAMEGDYKAATIYEARPYITGCTDGETPSVEGGTYDLNAMYSRPVARVPAGTATTAEAAAQAKSEEWYYWNPYEEMYDYEDLTWYDYYLVRGYAVVECGGLGTKDSDGFETCGTDLEIDAFKCVIEWLHGDRTAYTDKNSNIAIAADWSNGKVGMTGRSYAGTTQFGLATTGVKGLETIVPVAGIASWYEYTNAQGVSFDQIDYSGWLGFYCAGRYLDEADYATIKDAYENYLTQISNDQFALNGDYGKHWATRDYTEQPLLDWTGIQIPALIVHGLNDTNVKTKQFDLMYKKFVEADQPVKLLLHQGTHLTPTYPSQEYELKINGEYYDSILNKWFSHYLYNVSNGVEDMPNVTVQNNLDGSWDTYNDWRTTENQVFKVSSATTAATSSIKAAEGYYESGWNETKAGETAKYTFSVPSSMTIQGPVAVHLRLSAAAENFADLDGVQITVGLNDTSGDAFNAFIPERSYLPLDTLQEDGAWMGGGVSNFRLVQFRQTEVNSKPIGEGYIDVFNPEAGYASSTAVKRAERVQEGQFYDYVVYLQPTVYTVKAGHTLELTVDVAANSGVSLTVDNSASFVDIPLRKFADVADNDWYADAVDYVTTKRLMAGESATNFGANDQTTRGMLVTILYRLENQPEAGACDFRDVSEDQYYANAVAWASENGIVSGYGNGIFGPNEPINREQLAAILYRYAQYKNYDVSTKANLSVYTDAGEISGFAADAMAWANGNALIAGASETTLAPMGSALRAQVAAILMRFCENMK